MNNDRQTEPLTPKQRAEIFASSARHLRSVASEIEREHERLKLFGYHGVSRLSELAKMVRDEASELEGKAGSTHG